MKNLLSRSVLGALTLLAATAVVGVPSSAQGDPPAPAKAGPAAVAQKVTPVSPNAAKFLQKPVTVGKLILSAADRVAVKNALATAQTQYAKDNDAKKLTAAGAGLSRDASRVYRAKANDLVARKMKPQIPPSVPLAAEYALVGGTLTGYTEINCKISWTIDFVMQNRGNAPPPPVPSSETPLFMDWTPTAAGFPSGFEPVTAVLAAGATTPFRYTFIRSYTDYFEGCIPSQIPSNSQVGFGKFYGLGDVKYELSLVNNGFFVTELPEP